MAPTLVALFGPKRGVRLELGGVVVVGRSSSAGLQLIDGKVSREHCRLLTEAGRVVLEDLGSQNGTFVNGDRVKGRRALSPGDEIAVGDSLLLLDPDFAVLAARFGDATLVVSSAPAVADAIATESARRAEAAGGPGREVGALRALAAALASAPTADDAAAALLAAVEACFRAERCYLLAGAADRGGELRVIAGRTGDTAAGGGPGNERAPVVSRATLAAAARRRSALAVSDALDERALAGSRSVITRAARAVLVAPIVASDDVRGFLYLDRRAGADWSPADAALAEAIAALAALHGLGGAVAAPARARGEAATAAEPVGASPAFRRVLTLASSAARATSTVLITGESGTGKEEVARHVHRTSGRGAFVAVNCGAIPESLAESELFGHERGAFTGAVAAREGRVEAADGGTLFLDEVAELTPALQVKLLRVLQERSFCRLGSATPRQVDIRVIAATHRRLESEVAAGRFREDLFYRLNVLRIEIPPLRGRRADIAPLAAALLARTAAQLGRPDPGLAAAALAALERPAWPGNARELGNVLERALVLRAPGARGPLDEDEIVSALGEPPPVLPRASPPASAPPALLDKIAALERAEIVAALRAARGVKARAAKQLGISRPTLDKKMADLGIDLWSGEPGGQP